MATQYETRAVQPVSRQGGTDAREIASDALLRGDRVVVIRHGDDAYRLQRTAAGKLILTK